MMKPLSATVANVVGAECGEPWKVLNIAASHGIYGIGIANQNPNAEIYALDWCRLLN